MNPQLFQISNPESSGFSSMRLERLSNFFKKQVDQGDIAGLIATVSRSNQTVYYKKIGWMDLESSNSMNDDTIFMIASMTKPITAVAAMMLYEEGCFHLNTPISDFIPAFKVVQVYTGFNEQTNEIMLTPVQQEITIRHLFTHTSGLSYGWDPNDPVDQLYMQVQEKYKKGNIPFTNQALSAELPKLPLFFQPGSRWRYSLSIDLIGAIIEIITGLSLEVFLKERIFEPLEMRDTGFYVPPVKLSRVAKIYEKPDTDGELRWVQEVKPVQEPPSFCSGGGGLVSTIGDYALFCQMLVNGGEKNGVRFLSPKTMDLFAINQCPIVALPYFIEDGRNYNAGYGYSLGTKVLMDVAQSGMAGSVGEFGWGGAFNTYFWIDPTEALYGLLMLQYRARPDENFVTKQRFKQLTYQAMIS